MALRGDFSLHLLVTEEPALLAIRTEMTDGSMMRRFSSSVGVSPTGPGSCRLEMSLFMQPSICVPFGIRSMVGGQVRCWLAALHARRAPGAGAVRARVACRSVRAHASMSCSC